MEQGQQPDDLPQVNVTIDDRQRAGVWSNFARVSHSPYEFTLDFARIDFGDQPPSGIVVSRVSLSPLMVSQLIEALQQNWETFARRALPQEVYEDGPGDDSPSGE